MTPDQDNKLRNLYSAMFYGGPSMPAGQSLVQILQPGKVTRSSTTIQPSQQGDFSLFQEIADTKSLLILQAKVIADLTAKVEALSAKVP